MKRIAGALVVALALVAVLASTPGLAVARSSSTVQVTKGTIAWRTCSDPSLTAENLQCGTVTVPLDWSKPTGRKITLAVSRRRHTSADSAYQGVMLVNPGGPGSSGLSLASLADDVPHHGGDSYDWIGFDPRGVGASVPALSCDRYYFGYNRPAYVPTSTTITDEWRAMGFLYARACARNSHSGILAHLTTRDSARDMDAIRRALGQKQINYYGFSYGTYLGEVYSTLYPQRVRRQVFDGTVDPRTVWYQSNLDQNVPFDRNLGIWFGWIAKYDASYHLGRTAAAVRSAFIATWHRLDAHPVHAKGGELGGSEWIDAFLDAAYYQSTWPDLAATFSDLVNHGRVASLESAFLDADGLGDDNDYAAYLGVQCADASSPTRWSTWARDSRRVAARAPLSTWSNTWFNLPCLSWPARSQQPVTINGSKVASTLMINETLDAATPYAGSIEVRRLFPGARLIAEPGGTTHAGSLFGDACVDDAIANYLATGALPARRSGNRADKTCAPLPQPTPASGTAAAGTAAEERSTPAVTRAELQRLSLPR